MIPAFSYPSIVLFHFGFVLSFLASKYFGGGNSDTHTTPFILRVKMDTEKNGIEALPSHPTNGPIPLTMTTGSILGLAHNH